MKTIHKFELPAHIGHTFLVQMPRGAQPLHVGMQENKLTAWCAVNTDNEMCAHLFYVRGTGQPCDDIPHTAYHIGTLQLRVGSALVGGQPTEVVLHVFYGGQEEGSLHTVTQ